MKSIPHTELKTRQHRVDNAVARALRGAALASAIGALLLTLGCSKETEQPTSTATNPPSTSSTPVADAGNKAATVVEDSVVTSKIKTAFLTEDDLKSMDISVETVQGSVTLTGMVDSQAQIDNALRVARATEGAQTVQNLMTVKP
jgi:hyperosmotically inducible protein